jgi:carboxylesterase
MTGKNPHEEFCLLSGSKYAIVFVHGILGSPAQFRFLADELLRQGYDCMGLLLPGHGGDARAFSRNSCKQWQQYVDAAISRIKPQYEHVYLIGHSLGGLLCLNYAATHNVDGVILFNAPLKFKLGLKQLMFSFRILLSSPEKDDDFLLTYRQAFSVKAGRIYEYPLWLRQFASLYSLARKTRRILKEVKAKTLIVQSMKDESVQLRSAGLLKSGLVNAQAEIMELKESYHGYMTEKDKKKLLNAVERFVTRA